MIRLLLIASLILLATSTYAQSSTPLEATTTDGRIVILKSDGTWEFKKIAPPPSPTPPTNLVNNVVEAQSLPPKFTGHNVNILFDQLLDLRKRLDKSEFETTAEYEKRIIEEKQKPILDNLTIKDTFYLVVSGVEAEYNADLQKMKFFLRFWGTARRYLATLQKETQDKKTTYDLTDVNLYSIRLNSSDERYARESIFFDEINSLKLSKKDYLEGFAAEVNLNVEEAKRLKNTIKAVILVQFEEPYALRWTERQFQVRLIDIYFFDPQTGKILAKMSQVDKDVSEMSSPTDNSTISGGVLNGKAISLPKPPYPPIARAAHASGTVTVQVTIDESGKVISAHAVGGHPLLQQAAVQAAYQAQFMPTLRMSQPVKVTGVITYSFVAQ